MADGLPTQMRAGMTVTSLEIDNVLRVKMVKLTLDGKPVVLEGGNEQGKSSVLKAPDLLFASLKDAPAELLHEGAKSGKIEATIAILDEDGQPTDETIQVTRSLKSGKSPTLKVVFNGKRQKKPQALLESFLERTCLDPLKFMDMDEANQKAVLAELTGFDSSALDAEIAELEGNRRCANREAKERETRLKGMTRYSGVVEPISVKALMEELERLEAGNRRAERMQEDLNSCEDRLSRAREQKTELEKALRLAEREIAEAAKARECAAQAVEESCVMPTRDIREQIATADEHNARVRANDEYEEAKASAEDARRGADDLDKKLKAKRAERAKLSQEAASKLPLPDLEVTEDGVLYKGRPLAQAGSSARLRVSVAVAIARNADSQIKLLLVDDAEKLDRQRKAELVAQAQEAGFQVIMAQVGDGGPGTVVIEDGMVAGE